MYHISCHNDYQMELKDIFHNFKTYYLDSFSLGKNRNSNSIPSDSQRLHLKTRVQGRTDYINAVRCDSYEKKNAFILTQVPLTDTVDDLWRLVADHDVHGIVLLNSMDKEQPYWPKELNEKMTLGHINIKLIKETSSAYDGIVIRDFLLKRTRGPSSNRTIRQWQLTDWKDSQDGYGNVSVLKVLTDLMSRYQTNISEEQTIIVQCMDGVRRCGMYLAYSNLLDMLQCTGQLDVGFVVKQIKLVRPQALVDVVDMYAIYNWLASSVSTNNVQSMYYNNNNSYENI